MNRVAALFVIKDGPYYGFDFVDPWDEERDARKYKGPYPVVAHPPCQRWGKMWMGSPAYVAKTGVRKKKGDDGGCFKHALESVRKFGGVLEHPAHSHAWSFFNLNKPDPKLGWIKADNRGYTCFVEQGKYGHYARKPTWLYAVNCTLPDLKWGKSDPKFPEWALNKYGLEKCKKIGELGLQGGGKNSLIRNETPKEFQKILIEMALSVYKNE